MKTLNNGQEKEYFNKLPPPINSIYYYGIIYGLILYLLVTQFKGIQYKS